MNFRFRDLEWLVIDQDSDLAGKLLRRSEKMEVKDCLVPEKIPEVEGIGKC